MISDPKTKQKLADVARAKLEDSKSDIDRTWRYFENGNPLMAETQGLHRVQAAVNRAEMTIRNDVPRSKLSGAEAVKGSRNNFLPVSFMAVGTCMSRAVARISVDTALPTIGTGFLCAPQTANSPALFMTNKHVLQDIQDAENATVEFDFIDDDNIKPTLFRLDPSRCYVSDPIDSLDFAIVAIGQRFEGDQDISTFSWCPLSAADNKHAIGEFANIIQHPDGRKKEVVLQDNLIVSRGENGKMVHNVLHYIADTEPGSSGAPVFNNSWQVIALHHWGEATEGIHLNRVGMFDPKSVNQGVRISRIIKNLKSRLPDLSPHERTAISNLIHLGETFSPKKIAELHNADSIPTPQPSPYSEDRKGHDQNPMPVDPSLSATITVPLTITISVPGLQTNPPHRPVHNTPDRGHTSNIPQPPVIDPSPENFSGAEARLPKTGEGYRVDFLEHHIVPLPKMRANALNDVAPLRRPEKYPSAKYGELQFSHFSVVMNKVRKFPFFGACNVDGKTLFGINSDKDPYQYADKDASIFRASGAEGGYGWKSDRRIEKSYQTTNEWYTGKNDLIPRDGTDDADIYIPVADFDRGHIVRRTEPIWGPTEIGQAANYQTFNVVNAAPQTPQFNQDKTRYASEINPGEETRSWYGLEVAVLRAATDEDKKMNVFTGPVFTEDDPVYGPGKKGAGQRKIPLSFWKIAVWEDGDTLRALAMLSSQTWSLKQARPEAKNKKRKKGAESLANADQLFLLRDFLTTVSDIEAKTGIDFGSMVRDADLLDGMDNDTLNEFSLQDFRHLLRTQRDMANA